MSDTAGKRVIVLPGDFRLPVPHGMDVDEFMWRHSAAAVTEGLCPVHRTALESVLNNTRLCCFSCGKYWWVTGDEVGWELTYDPHAMTGW